MKVDNKSLHESILYICSNEYKYFLAKSNVVGVGLGYKIKRGFCTFEKCIKVFVTKKISKKYLSNKDVVPILYKGIKTDVKESGIIYASSLTQRVRPVPGGYSIGPTDAPAHYKPTLGTLGCLVTDDTNIYILSNNHVLAYENRLAIDSPIVQPAINDGGKPSRDIIAYLSKFVPLKFSTAKEKPENLMDCAIARVADKKLVLSKLYLLGEIKDITVPYLHQRVTKVGRTSELTLGMVNAIGITCVIKYDFGSVLFKEQIESNKMSEIGDSGSVVMDTNNYAVGLLCASSPTNSFFNSMENVLESLNVKIV